MSLALNARCSAQLQRVLESRTFHNTEVLKRLLEYLGRVALEGQADDLKEYRVGIEAFGKPPDYDSKTDSSVRVQAGKLRQKLDEYYRTEGLEDPLIIELPKGHFKLEFRPRREEVPASARIRRPRWLVPVLVAVAAVAAALLIEARLHHAGKPASTWNAEMQEFWAPFLESSRPLMLCLGAPLFNKVDNSFFRDPAVNTREAAAASERLRAVERALGAAGSAPAYPYTGVGEAAGAFELARFFLPRGRDLSLNISNLLSWDSIARHNVIFVGPPKANLQIKDLPVEVDFDIRHARVQNLRPRGGEPKTFPETWSSDGSSLEEGHALITRIPGLHGSGDILILAATASEGTRAAVEYVTRPEYITSFVAWMRQSQGKVPPHFQAVIRARFKFQTPIAIERVAFHVLKTG